MSGWRLGGVVLGCGLVCLVVGCGSSGISNYGTIGTLAGNATSGYVGDGGAALKAEFVAPACVVVDAAGNVYVADPGAHTVRRIAAGTGTISTVAGTGMAGYGGDGGPATAATLHSPNGCALDAAGNLYIADTANNVVRKVTAATGVISTVAGNGIGAGSTVGGFSGDGGPALMAGMNHPYGVAVDAAGNLYISDTMNGRVRKVTAGTNVITTIAGNGGTGLSGDGGAATAATMYNPEGLAVDGAGNVYVAEEANNVVRRIAAAGTISTLAGGLSYGFGGNGQAATSALLDGPTAVALDSAGLVYVTDAGNMEVRRIQADGTIQAVAGDATQGYTGDGGMATNAELNSPRGIAFDAKGAMYLADTGNFVVRKITP